MLLAEAFNPDAFIKPVGFLSGLSLPTFSGFPLAGRADGFQ